jgi:hypothetical protein
MIQLRETLQPIFRTAHVNENVELYRGPIQLACGNALRNGSDTPIVLSWLPSPRLLAYPPIGPPPGPLDDLSIGIFYDDAWCFDETAMLWNGDWYRAKCRLRRLRFGAAHPPFTLQLENLEAGTPKSLTAISFHLVNFPNFIGDWISEGSERRRGRILLSTDGWVLTIDNLKETSQLREELDEIGGFGITHVGQLAREDELPFPLEDAQILLRGLYYFLSFARGAWSAPILLSGVGLNGERWQEWSLPLLDQGQHEWSWPPRNAEGTAIAKAWPGFFRLWMTESWRDPIAAAISWYVEAAKGVLVESHFVLGQAALELLSWVENVERRGLVSAHGFNALPASDHLQLLLVLAKISPELPDALSDLKKRAKASNWANGPSALTELRNGVVHPKIRDRVFGTEMKIRAEAWRLMMHYLQLVILRLLDYDGRYFDYLLGAEAIVPWS